MKYQLLRPLNDRERSGLKESIRKRGVKQPIVVDESGNILDGHHRKELAEELGVDCPRVTETGLNEDEKVALVYELNDERRQQTREEIRAHTAALLKENPAMSARQIADKVGSTHPTVSAARKALEATGDVVNSSTTITDTLGRKQLRKREGTSNATERRLRRLERDHPDLLDKVESGEMTAFAGYKEATNRDGPRGRGRPKGSKSAPKADNGRKSVMIRLGWDFEDVSTKIADHYTVGELDMLWARIRLKKGIS